MIARSNEKFKIFDNAYYLKRNNHDVHKFFLSTDFKVIKYSTYWRSNNKIIEFKKVRYNNDSKK